MSVKNDAYIVIGVAGLAVCAVSLIVWGAYKDMEVALLRRLGLRKTSDRVELAADRALRQLAGVPEPGEPWDY